MDNSLTRFDLKTHTSYRVILDVDGKSLYDANDFALYAMTDSSTDAKLDHSATTINNAIGWASDIADLYSADDIKTHISRFESVYNYQQLLTPKIEDLEAQDSRILEAINTLNTTDAEIISEIGKVREEIGELDATEALERLDDHDAALEKLNQDITSLENADITITNNINTNKANIASINATIDKMKDDYDEEIGDIQGVISNNSFDIKELQSDTVKIRGRVVVLEENVANNSKNLLEEAALRAAADTELRIKIDNEIQRATEAEDILSAGLNNTNEELGALTNEVRTNNTTITNRVETEEQTRAMADKALDNRATVLEATARTQANELAGLTTRMIAAETDKSVVRNDYVVGQPKTIVAKIVVLEPKAIEDIAIMVEVPYSTEAEQNTWKEKLTTAGIIDEDTDLSNIAAEQVYEILKLESKIEAGTLYLIQEEE